MAGEETCQLLKHPAYPAVFYFCLGLLIGKRANWQAASLLREIVFILIPATLMLVFFP